MANEDNSKTICALGALSIGVGAIIGGGFFATFGITVAEAKGETPISFLIAGAIAQGSPALPRLFSIKPLPLCAVLAGLVPR
jgi:hypothetical protein